MLSGDCNGDSLLDQFDSDLGDCLSCDIADFNGDDLVSVQDIFEFLTVYFANDTDDCQWRVAAAGNSDRCRSPRSRPLERRAV